jgi:CheY-like chemotaxis protein
MNATPDTSPPVLVVDDEADQRESLVLLFKLSGFPAVGAADGAEALEYLDAHPPPCLVLTDLSMPQVDGLQLCRLIRQRPRLAGVPVVVCSGSPAYRRQAEAAGAAFARKPVEPEALLDLVRRHCASRARAGQRAPSV